MNVHEELARAEACVQGLERAVARLRGRVDDDVDVQRLADDVVRCGQDLALLRRTSTAAPPLADVDHLVVVPDGDYDTSLWDDGDCDAEGLGVPGRRAP